MKKIEVTNCNDCPFVQWDVDFDQDYIGANCGLASNLDTAPSVSYGGNVLSEGSDYFRSNIKSPQWCPLKNEEYSIKFKL